LLLLNDGKIQQEIAEFIGCSKNKVCYWCVHGEPDNIEELESLLHQLLNEGKLIIK
jgi:hypothetical protein